ncbi:MAG: hypothetical protein ABIT10_05675 [Alteraurantiacibacter sp.]
MKNSAGKLAIMVAGLAVLGGTAAHAQDVSRAPISGTINLDAGFVPDPKIISVTSGGRHDTSSNIGGACTGFVSGAADVRVNYNTASNVPLIFSVAADGDTTLVINAPDGQWYCNDDTDGYNPQVRFDQPHTGRYSVWIGTYGGREQMPARLSITEIDNTPPPPEPAAFLDGNLPATYGYVSLVSGFTPDPRTVQLTAGGTIAGSTVDETCYGTFAAAPDVALEYSAGSLPLIISVASESDTTLLITDPQGNTWCDDDGGVNGTNPGLRFDKPASGTYGIWVGSYGGDNAAATLHISEVSSQ